MDINQLREKFEATARQFIKREGIEQLLDDLRFTDFYTAPASTKYHDAEEGGLCKHSLEVFQILESDLNGHTEFDKESIAIVALFHDLCKMGYYKVEMRNTKNEAGKWVQVPYYTVDDAVPLGHGEKSVILLMDKIKLSLEEIMAIRWHMNGFEPKENYQYMSKAYSEYPLAVYLAIADLKSTYIG